VYVERGGKKVEVTINHDAGVSTAHCLTSQCLMNLNFDHTMIHNSAKHVDEVLFDCKSETIENSHGSQRTEGALNVVSDMRR
jgi:hypothetical protein